MWHIQQNYNVELEPESDSESEAESEAKLDPSDRLCVRSRSYPNPVEYDYIPNPIRLQPYRARSFKQIKGKSSQLI